MKHLAAFLLSTSALLAAAQNCQHSTFYPQMAEWNSGWQNACLDNTGGVLYNEWTLGMSYGRIAPDGTSDWSRRIVHMSQDVWLSPMGIAPRPDGGSWVWGTFSPAWQYDAPCIVSVGPDGQYDQARIYMADSSYQGYGAYVTTLLPRTDSGVMLPCGTYYRGALGLGRLDPNGLPIWYNRYAVTEVEGPNMIYLVGSALEPDNSVTLIGARNNSDQLSIMRINEDGSGQWAYTYELPGVRALSMIRASDGSFYVAASYNGLEGCMVHLNDDGSFDQAMSYPDRIRGIVEMPGGDLLTSTWGTGPGLLRLAADGSVVSAWTSAVPNDYTCRVIGMRNDSVYVEHHSDPGTSMPWTGLTIATSVADLSCAFNAATAPSSTLLGGPVSVSDTLIVTPDELKTWTMNIGESLGAGDLDVISFGAAGPARPGFSTMVYVHAQNMGGATSGPLTCSITHDPLLTLVNTWPTPSSISGNTVTWTGLDSLAGFDTEFMYMELAVPADVNLIGTTLNHSCTVTQDSVEVDLANNAMSFSREITGSYDPNDKLVEPRDFYHIENDSVLDYTIRFQNTGNDTAFTVVVRDTLPLDVDTRTFEMGAASHPYTYSLTGNGILTFTFADILLPDSNTNEALSHGLVNFRIKPILPLALGQEITNAADIYFDFNPPIRTPDATVVVTDETGVHPAVKPEKLNVFPVPVRNVLTAVLPNGFEPVSAFAIGVDGRRVPLFTRGIVAQQAEYRTEQLPPGAYVLTLHDRSGKRRSARFTKE